MTDDMNEDNAHFHYRESERRFRKRDSQGWRESINKALYIEPDNIDYFLLRGEQLCYEEEYEKAILDLTVYIDGVLDILKHAYIKRKIAYMELGMKEEALADLNHLIERGLATDFETYRHRAFDMYQLGNFDQAIADFTSAYYLEPENSINLLNRAHAYYGAKMYRNALHDLEEALKFTDDEHEKNAIYLWLGKVYFQINQHDKALTYFNKYAEFSGWDIQNTAQLYMEAFAPDDKA